jgi:hypothetical protein
MKLVEYRSLNWQDKQEAFWAWCEANDLDHTDPDSKEDFINTLKEAA